MRRGVLRLFAYAHPLSKSRKVRNMFDVEYSSHCESGSRSYTHGGRQEWQIPLNIISWTESHEHVFVSVGA